MSDQLYQQVLQAVQSKERKAIILSLKNLHHFIIKAPPATREVPKALITKLIELLASKNTLLWYEKSMCTKVLLESCPRENLKLQLPDEAWVETQLPYLLPISIVQSSCDRTLQNDTVLQLVRWMSMPGYPSGSQSMCLTAFMTLVQQQPDTLTEEHIALVNNQLKEWLQTGELREAVNPYKTFFKQKAGQTAPITEVDGKRSTDFFTLLSIGQYYTPKQKMNIHAFCVLRPWLVKVVAFHKLRNADNDSQRQSSSRKSSTSLAGRRIDDDDTEEEEEEGNNEGAVGKEVLGSLPDSSIMFAPVTSGMSQKQSRKDSFSSPADSNLPYTSTPQKSEAQKLRKSSVCSSNPGASSPTTGTPGSYSDLCGPQTNYWTGSTTSSSNQGTPNQCSFMRSMSRDSPLGNIDSSASLSHLPPLGTLPTQHSISSDYSASERSGRSSPSQWSMSSSRSSVWESMNETTTHAAGGELTDGAFKYCCRLLKQALLIPLEKRNVTTQHAVLIELIGILDNSCLLNKDLIERAGKQVQNLSKRLRSENARIIIPYLQFMLHHGKHIDNYDPSENQEVFFRQVLALQYADDAVAMDTMQFVLSNLETLCYDTDILSKYFPNLFKILAWHTCFKEDFFQILPAILSKTTAMGVVHMILDLPTITACLKLSRSSSKPQTPSKPVPEKALQAFNDPQLNRLFKFFLRDHAGNGDTLSSNQFDQVHAALKSMAVSDTKVHSVARMVPELLKLVLDELIEEGGMEVAAKLVPVMLERSILLLDVPGYKNNINKLFRHYLPLLFQHYPQLVIEEFNNLMDYLGDSSNISNSGEEFYKQVLVVVGGYLNPTSMLCASGKRRSKHSLRELVRRMYETLEPLCYEISPAGGRSQCTEKTQRSTQLITELMFTNAKLCSRNPELIQRGILCVNKLSSPYEELSHCAAEVISTLKLPSMAGSVFSGNSPLDERCQLEKLEQLDSCSLPVLLSCTSNLLQITPVTPVIQGAH